MTKAKRALPRTIQPELLKSWELSEAEMNSGLPLTLSFIGLFTICDKEGRFVWNPTRIRCEVFPYRTDIEMDVVLSELFRLNAIVKYTHKDENSVPIEYGYVVDWRDIQYVNNKEKASVFPSHLHPQSKIVAAPATPKARKLTETQEKVVLVNKEIETAPDYSPAIDFPKGESVKCEVDSPSQTSIQAPATEQRAGASSIPATPPLEVLDLFGEELKTVVAVKSKSAKSIPENFRMEKGVPYRTDTDGGVLVLSASVADNSPAVDGLEFVVASGDVVMVTFGKVEEYQRIYPDSDVVTWMRQSAQWTKDNVRKRKTLSGLPTFISTWLSTSQNRGQGVGFSSVNRGGVHGKPSQTSRVTMAVERMQNRLNIQQA